jgi:hypothetical protein
MVGVPFSSLAYVFRRQPGSDGKEHLLATPWTFWFNRRLQGASRSKDSYERNIKRVAAFDTVCTILFVGGVGVVCMHVCVCAVNE